MSYHVDISPALLARVRVLFQEAVAVGQGADFLRESRELITRLEVNPHGTGDPLFHTRIGDLACIAAWRPVVFNFVIHEQPPIVWVVKVERISTHME